ncbi:MAG: DUF362 domain-containing protein [Lentisphaeria bacterium]|nr:DUF362 domain-containing protein [Lentisphaeria bacterium]
MTPRPCVTAAPCRDYESARLRSALERVIAPQLAQYGSLSGRKLLLKPNLLAWRRADDPACVRPALLLECVKVFLDAGAKVSILENPAVQTAPAVIRAMGLTDELERLGVEVRSFADFAPVRPLPEMRFRNFELAREYLDFDVVADLAKAKTHGMMTLTLCVKNLFGLVKGSERMAWHLNVGRDFSCFADMLLDIYLAVRPQFNIVDAVICMEGNGPGSGTPADRGWIFGGTDSLALDSWLAPLLLGGGEELLLVRRARERGLLSGYEVIGETPEIAPLQLPPPPGLLCEWGVMLPPGLKKQLRELLVARPVLDPEKCIGCGLCAKMCPPATLKVVDGKARFDYPNCIRCFCCQEHCPQGAITIRKGVLMGLMETMERGVRKLFSH